MSSGSFRSLLSFLSASPGMVEVPGKGCGMVSGADTREVVALVPGLVRGDQ